jgi:hypothetical protein
MENVARFFFFCVGGFSLAFQQDTNEFNSLVSDPNAAERSLILTQGRRRTAFEGPAQFIPIASLYDLAQEP